jgi:RHS repeat-associated protein
VVKTIDRRGRETRYVYDAMRNLTDVFDAENRNTHFTHCTCGALEGIIDGESRVTEWERDLQNRPTKKKINGVPVFSYFYGPNTGRLVGIEDGKGQRTNYEYFADDRLKRVFYTAATGTALPGAALPVPTPEVSYTYDARFGRLDTMTDGTGTTSYTYVPIMPTDAVYGDGQLASVGGRIAGDTIGYAYDQLGRLTTRTFDGTTTSVSGYDALGRVLSTVNALGTWTPTYEGLSGRVDFVQQTVGAVAKLKTDFSWEATGERRLTGIAHTFGAGNAAVSSFGYGYLRNNANDPTGQIHQWTQNHSGLGGARTVALGYDEVDQLKTAVRTETGGAVSGSWEYRYDRSGNRFRAMENGLVKEFGVNDMNQFTGTVAAQKFPVKFAGTTNEPSDVTVGGANAGTNTTNWEAEALVGPGANSVEIRATEKNVTPGKVAQTTVRHANLTLPASPARAFAYDGNGSTESDGLRTYTWDAANRLKTVATGTSVTEFTYDGGNRWVRIVEKENNVVVGSREVIWEGASIAQLRLKNAAGTELERRTFHAGGEIRSGTAIGATPLALLHTSDHLGSIRELVDASTGAIRARYDYDPYGKRTKLSGDLEADQGYTGHYEHSVSSLTLAPFRAYDTVIGRWISRDPIEESGGLNLYGYVGGNVAGAVDPLGWAPGDNFNSFNAAMWDALKYAHAETKKNDREYGGWVYERKNRPGVFGYTCVQGDKKSIDGNWALSARPEWDRSSEFFHSHPHAKGMFQSPTFAELFSARNPDKKTTGDMGWSDNNQIPIWLITPKGVCKRYSPGPADAKSEYHKGTTTEHGNIFRDGALKFKR